MSALKVPNLQLWPVDVFAIFKLANLALALVSTFCVLPVTVKGPSGDELSESDGKFLNKIVTWASPWIVLKSGTMVLN